MLAIKKKDEIIYEFIALFGNNDGYIFFSGEFHGLYGNNDVCIFFQENSMVYMVTMMV
jgi:hypothetical protein